MQTIETGFIGSDIVALCHDDYYQYAMYAELKGNEYFVRMASTHGLVTTERFPASKGMQQIVHLSMAAHLKIVQKLEEVGDNKTERNTDKSLN